MKCHNFCAGVYEIIITSVQVYMKCHNFCAGVDEIS